MQPSNTIYTSLTKVLEVSCTWVVMAMLQKSSLPHAHINYSSCLEFIPPLTHSLHCIQSQWQIHFLHLFVSSFSTLYVLTVVILCGFICYLFCMSACDIYGRRINVHILPYSRFKKQGSVLWFAHLVVPIGSGLQSLLPYRAHRACYNSKEWLRYIRLHHHHHHHHHQN